MDVVPVAEIIATHPEHQRLKHQARFEDGAGFVDGKYCALQEACVPITDLGFTRADAVYDVVTVSRGQFFRLEYHQRRFQKSCDRIRVKNSYTMEEEAEILHRLVAMTGLKDAYVWWGITRGATPADSSKRLNPDNFQNRYYAYVTPYIFINNDEQRKRGIHLWICEDYIRISPQAVDPRAKNFCSLDLAMSLYEAGDNGAEWSVLTDGQGHLAESPGSNIFLIKNGVAATPDSGCLEGITRQSTIDLCRELDIPCEVRQVSKQELIDADEAFLTSSAGGIMPVAVVNNRVLSGNGGPGALTSQLHNAYWEKRWAGWDATPVRYELGESDEDGE